MGRTKHANSERKENETRSSSFSVLKILNFNFQPNDTYLTANCPSSNNTGRIALLKRHIGSVVAIKTRTVKTFVKLSMAFVDE